MISQTNAVIELQFLFYLIPVIIGFQLGFYYFYQYYKIRDVNLKLNRILLSFGMFILAIVIGALMIQIARNFVSDPVLKDIIYKIGWSMAFFAPIGLEIFTLTEDFAKITNLIVMKVLVILNCLAIILAIVAPSTRSPPFIIAIIFVLLNGVNVLRFQIVLIKKSVGNIKKKFLLFFIGTITSLVAIFFAIAVALGVLKTLELELIVYYTGISFLLTGFIIMFFSASNFPPFYEFEWRDKLSKLYIINRSNNDCLYYFDFSEEFIFDKNKKDEGRKLTTRGKESLHSGGIIGIDMIIASITGTQNQKIDIIKHEKSYILLEYSSEPFNIIFALIIKKELISIRHLIQSIKKQFESFYREILSKLDSFKGNQALLFGSFDVILKGLIQE
jgi:hypothetical protein